MKVCFLFLIFSLNVKVIFAAEIYPSLMDVKIGQYFNHPQRRERIDENSPTTQFRVPNYGSTKELFSEYQISILNSTENVAIVTAEAVLKDIGECPEIIERVSSWASEKYPGYKSIPSEKSQLLGDGEYGLDEKNTYYVIECRGTYGPFWSVHFQIRGIEQDKLLRKAWSKFINNEKH